jgi:predicted metal-dependent HD superfamily phosphohydrolase
LTEAVPSVLVGRLVEVLGDRPEVRAAAEEVVARYAEPQRSYHTGEHLAEMFDALDLLTSDVRAEVVCAVLWHDAVYDPTAGDNEERSADLAQAALTDLGMSARPVEETVRLTATHQPAAGDENGMLLCDADLAVLAAAPARYDAYAAAVRREYAFVADEAFRAGRAAVLRSLSAGDWIYTTEAARERWEEPARANLARELRSLEA